MTNVTEREMPAMQCTRTYFSLLQYISLGEVLLHELDCVLKVT